MSERATLSITGMHCDACVRRVTAALRKVDGVEEAQVAVGSASVSFDPARTAPAALAGAVQQAGFTAVVQPA